MMRCIHLLAILLGIFFLGGAFRMASIAINTKRMSDRRNQQGKHYKQAYKEFTHAPTNTLCGLKIN